MSTTLVRVKACVSAGQTRVSRHDGKELDEDDVGLDDVVASTPGAEIFEDYASELRGPSVLVLHRLLEQIFAMLAEESTYEGAMRRFDELRLDTGPLLVRLARGTAVARGIGVTEG